MKSGPDLLLATSSERWNVAEVALFIKTFLRNETLFEVVDSIHRHASALDYRIYIADDGKVDPARANLYEQLEEQGHCIVRLPFDVGASAGRNAALRYIDEPYVLRMDDDFVFTDDTRVDLMIRVLAKDESIGAVADLEVQRHRDKGVQAGELSPFQGALHQHGSTLWKVPAVLDQIEWEVVDGVRIARCEFTRNFLLIRRALLDHLRWDHRLKIRGEHLDFMLQIVRRSEWDLAFTPDSRHVHAGPPGAKQPKGYSEYRYRNEGYRDVLYEKWGVRRILIDHPEGSPRWRRSLRSGIQRLRG